MKRLLAFVAVLFTACSNPQPGPDKTVAGMVLGAGWGAGAGAIVGNQVSTPGEGVAVGAGVGAVSGALQGAGYDLAEGGILEEQRNLQAVQIQNQATARELQNVQAKLDRAMAADVAGGMYQVFFDSDATSLRSGAIANLEVIADSIRTSPYATSVNVVGHTDDSGSPEHNQRVAEARARTVASYLAARGISSDRIQVQSFGSTRPIASNSTDVGRQLNRRADVYIGR